MSSYNSLQICKYVSILLKYSDCYNMNVFVSCYMICYTDYFYESVNYWLFEVLYCDINISFYSILCFIVNSSLRLCRSDEQCQRFHATYIKLAFIGQHHFIWKSFIHSDIIYKPRLKHPHSKQQRKWNTNYKKTERTMYIKAVIWKRMCKMK